MIDVSTLTKAERREYPPDGTFGNPYPFVRWEGTAHGVTLSFYTQDLDAEYWVSPIWTMREKGVALVDSTGSMVKNERRDR